MSPWVLLFSFAVSLVLHALLMYGDYSSHQNIVEKNAAREIRLLIRTRQQISIDTGEISEDTNTEISAQINTNQALHTSEIQTRPLPEPAETPEQIDSSVQTHAPDQVSKFTALSPTAPSHASLHSPATTPDNSLEKEIVLREAKIIDLKRPHYPLVAKRRGHEGTVIFEIVIMPDGTPFEIRKISSSRHPELDWAALNALKEASFIPATENGKPTRSIKKIAFTFSLDN